MPRSLALAILLGAACAGSAAAQVLDETLVPRGRLRLEVRPISLAWDSRFGRDASGTEREEELGEDLTDPTGLLFFPGVEDLVSEVEALTGTTGYAPTLGDLQGRVGHQVTRIDVGLHLGVTDWLTIGASLPWMRVRDDIDLVFTPDTLGGGALGLSPTLTSSSAVDGYLGAVGAAFTEVTGHAATTCAAGPSPECTAAQALADRTGAFGSSISAAYAASLLFPLTGSPTATSLDAVASALDADLMAAGLAGIGAGMVFATDAVTEETLVTLPTLGGFGVGGALPLRSRRGAWQTGDLEVSALVRVAERAPGSGRVSYLLTAGVLGRFATGFPEDPDVPLDVGSGDGQTDVEGRVTGSLAVGRLALTLGGRYGLQRPTTLVRRVAEPENVLAPLATRASLEFDPGEYTVLEVAPALRITDQLWLTGHLRAFRKGADSYTLVDPSSGLDPTVLETESEVRLTETGWGLRYSTMKAWSDGEASRPLELHLRVLRATAGGGGQTPKWTRLEAGARIFRRFWGDDPRPSGDEPSR